MPKRYNPFRLYLAALTCCLTFYGNPEASLPAAKPEEQPFECKVAQKLFIDGDHEHKERSYGYRWPLSGQLFYQP